MTIAGLTTVTDLIQGKVQVIGQVPLIDHRIVIVNDDTSTLF